MSSSTPDLPVPAEGPPPGPGMPIYDGQHPVLSGYGASGFNDPSLAAIPEFVIVGFTGRSGHTAQVLASRKLDDVRVRRLQVGSDEDDRWVYAAREPIPEFYRIAADMRRFQWVYGADMQAVLGRLGRMWKNDED